MEIWKYIFTRHCNLNILYSCVSIPDCNLNISNFHQQQSRMWQISWWRPIHKESAGNQCWQVLLQISKSTRTYWPASDTDRIRGNFHSLCVRFILLRQGCATRILFVPAPLCRYTLYKSEQYKEYIKNTVVHCVTWRVVHNCNSAIWSAIGLWLLVI